MKIINQTKNTILADTVIVANTFLKRLKGLLGKNGLGQNQALIIKPCNSIHTFFMRFSIDVLFVDGNNKAIQAVPSFKPFRISPVNFKAALVIELPSGSLASTSTCVGDTLLIE